MNTALRVKSRVFSFECYNIFQNGLSFMRQKDKSQNGGKKKSKYVKSSENKHFLPPDAHAYVSVSGVKICLFSEDLAYFGFLLPAF